MSTFGKTTIGAFAQNVGSDMKHAIRVTLPVDAELSSITAYLDGQNVSAPPGESTAIRFCVYADSAGAPAALEGVTVDGVIEEGAMGAWVTLDFASSLGLVAGTYYLAVQTGVEDVVRYYYDDADEGDQSYNADTFAGGASDPFGGLFGPDAFTNDELSIYASYIETWSVYDEDVHHIGLASEGGAARGYMLEGAYSKDLQRLPTPEEFGGGDDFIGKVPHLARWSQDDFLGGQYGYIWGDDNRQFASSRGLIPSQLGTSLRTVPPLVDWNVDAATHDFATAKLSVERYDHYLLRATEISTWQFDVETGAVQEGTVAASPVRVTGMCIVGGGSSPTLYEMRRSQPSLGGDGSAHLRAQPLPLSGAASVNYGAPIAGFPGTAFVGMISNGSLLVVQSNRKLYTAKVPDTGTTVDWVFIDDLPGVWKDAIVYNGVTYILCDAGDGTWLITFDGTNALPITVLPFNFTGYCMAAYGGRIYIGGSGRDITGADSYGELYEVTASSVRLVRTFAPESRISGATAPVAVYDLTVHEGLLFLGVSGESLIAYDVTTDSFYGAMDVGSPVDANAHEKTLISVGETLAAFVSTSTANMTGFYLIASDSADIDAGGYICEFVTSDFQPEPAREKRWSHLHVHTRYGAVDTVEWSSDGGETYTALVVDSMMEGDFWHNEVELMGVPISTRIRLRVRFDMADTVDEFTELVALTMQFAFLDNGKHAWQFVINASEDIEGLDSSDVIGNVAAVLNTLTQHATSRETLVLTDVDGQEYDCMMIDASLRRPIVGPRGASGAAEAFVHVTLIEV